MIRKKIFALFFYSLVEGISNDLRLPFDASSYEYYSHIWTSQHSSWRSFHLNNIPCSSFSLPVCLNGTILGSEELPCSIYHCEEANDNNINGCSSYTSPDTLDTTPILSDQAPSCSGFIPDALFDPSVVLDEGIAPLFSPITVIGLEIKGKLLSASDSISQCVPIVNASFIAFHADSSLLQNISSSPSWPSSQSIQYDLRQVSCASTVTTDENGIYSFRTTFPPSYGPPRHADFIFSVHGFVPLTTRLYFDLDTRLYQLLNPENIAFPSRVNSSESDYSRIHRVGKVAFIPALTTASNSSAQSGFFSTSFDIVLQPERDVDADQVSTLLPLNGIWFDQNGEMVLIETQGTVFNAVEYPHTRSWGSVLGYVLKNTIYGVDFRQNIPFSTISAQPEEMMRLAFWGTMKGILKSESNPFIEWGSAESSFVWTKQMPPTQTGYRYLKLSIFRDSGSVSVPLQINEINYFEGLLGLDAVLRSNQFMLSALIPSPLRVSCSSYLDQNHHCYRAFDGSLLPNNAWEAQSTGERETNDPLRPPYQWILLDLGPIRRSLPTALSITCGVGSASTVATGCPLSFSLTASADSINYDILLYRDGTQSTAYANNSFYLPFFTESPNGRPNGRSCGSCEQPPAFACKINSFDASCASQYCGSNVCSNMPDCPLGTYRRYRSLRTDVQSDCAPCPAV